MGNTGSRTKKEMTMYRTSGIIDEFPDEGVEARLAVLDVRSAVVGIS